MAASGASPRPAALLLLVALLGGAIAGSEQQSRQLQQERASCANTMAGRWYVADDKGMVCPRDSLDYTTGCCKGGELHSCATCLEADKCCSQFEHCVSCCLKPRHHAQQHMADIYRGRNKPETGRWATPFEYCQAVCRTTARSTEHENAFILDRKHCYSKLGRPQVPVPPAPPLPKDITLHLSASGQTCDAACAAKHMECRGEHFPAINDCNSLRSKFMCEAGCGVAAPDQKEFPGYIEGGAPKHMRPAFCATLVPYPGQAAAEFNCSGAGGSVRRLCPCAPLPKVEVQPDAAAAAAARDSSSGDGGAAAEEAAAAAAAAQQQAAAAAGGTQQQDAAAAEQAAAAQQQAAAAGQQNQQQPALQVGEQQDKPAADAAAAAAGQQQR